MPSVALVHKHQALDLIWYQGRRFKTWSVDGGCFAEFPGPDVGPRGATRKSLVNELVLTQMQV